MLPFEREYSRSVTCTEAERRLIDSVGLLEVPGLPVAQLHLLLDQIGRQQEVGRERIRFSLFRGDYRPSRPIAGPRRAAQNPVVIGMWIVTQMEVAELVGGCEPLHAERSPR